MSTKEIGIHENIILALEGIIEEVSKEIGEKVQDSINEINNGAIPAGDGPCQNHVRNIRKMALIRYETVKSRIGTHISSRIIEEVDVKPIRKLQEKREQITQLKTEKEQAEEEQRRVLDELELPDYEKFQLYDGQNNERESSKISKTVEETYKKYVANKNKKLFVGIIVTLLCAAADFSIVYALFQESNFTTRASIVTAIIVVGVLDIPPFILGYIQKKRDDKIRLWQLRNEKKGLSVEIRRDNSTIRILKAAILVFLFVYILVRFLLFLGGGDFNKAFHAVIERNFQFQDSVFSSADIMSAFAPLGTSAVALAVGVMLYTSYTDYVKKAIVLINNGLEDAVKEYEEQINACINKLKNLKTEFVELEHQIWTFYMREKEWPQNEEDFLKQVIKAFQDVNIPLYQQTYRRCVSLLRNKAELELQEINAKIAPNVANISAILSMPISEDERTMLDELGINGKSTITEVKDIGEQISKLTEF